MPGGPQTIEKPLVLERAAFLASFGRSQRSRKMLRHKALGLCPKPRQARREACALWALGPKAQSDPQRGSETMSATVREARMIEQPGHKKRGKRQTAAHTAGPLARTSPQRFGEPQLSKLKSESSDMRGGFGSLASARQPYAASRPGALRRRARGKRRTPAEKIGASRAFPPSESYLAFASLYTPSHHRIGNWITAAMAAVYSTHTSARPKCPPSRATPLKYT